MKKETEKTVIEGLQQVNAVLMDMLWRDAHTRKWLTWGGSKGEAAARYHYERLAAIEDRLDCEDDDEE